MSFGMTAMPEARLAREAELCYTLVALVTDYDCWRRPPAPDAKPAPDAPSADPQALLEEIIANLKAASDNAMDLITRALPLIASRQEELLGAPARSALRLAIWSDKARIPREQIETLAPLWGKYFQG
jgi:5'-methylthioadenosine phosphorylase